MALSKEEIRFRRIEKVYGLSEKDYRKMDTGKCPLCLRVWDNRVVPCVDHDHRTGFVRGLLCRYCNRYVLGRLSDVDVASRIRDYLKNQPMKTKVPPKKKTRKRRKRK